MIIHGNQKPSRNFFYDMNWGVCRNHRSKGLEIDSRNYDLDNCRVLGNLHPLKEIFHSTSCDFGGFRSYIWYWMEAIYWNWTCSLKLHWSKIWPTSTLLHFDPLKTLTVLTFYPVLFGMWCRRKLHIVLLSWSSWFFKISYMCWICFVESCYLDLQLTITCHFMSNYWYFCTFFLLQEQQVTLFSFKQSSCLWFVRMRRCPHPKLFV